MSVYKLAPFTFQKSGIFYFQRRVPVDLQSYYKANRILFSLRTRNARVAASRALAAATKLDEFWATLRSQNSDIPGLRLLLTAEDRSRPVSPPITEAMALYRAQKGRGKGPTFHAAANRAVTYLVAEIGDKPLLAIVKADATRFRDALFKRGLSSTSVRRVFTTIRAVVNFAFSELGISEPNPFVGVYLESGRGVTERQPLPVPLIRRVQAECRKHDDDLRWLVALVSDTGMRLAEAAGLALDDLVLDREIPHVRIRPHEWRSLKNKASERDVPLVGEALWAAQRIKAMEPGPYAFPRYTKGGRTNANSASAALNKWLASVVGTGFSMHSFRHSMRDRLRAVACPADMIDQIGGWTTPGQGQAYGKGYTVSDLSWMLNKTRPSATIADRNCPQI